MIFFIFYGHVDNFHKSFEMENLKTCAFIFQNMCFPKSDIEKHVFRKQILYWEWEEDTSTEIGQNSYGFEGPTVEIEISEVLFIMNQ